MCLPPHTCKSCESHNLYFASKQYCILVHLSNFTVTEIDCGPVPEQLVNGELVEVNGTTIGSVAVYECKEGFEFPDENSTRSCLASGEWSNEDNYKMQY